MNQPTIVYLQGKLCSRPAESAESAGGNKVFPMKPGPPLVVNSLKLSSSALSSVLGDARLIAQRWRIVGETGED